MAEERPSMAPQASQRSRRGLAEMVRIDGEGVARPVGEAATLRLRERQGAYRVLPSPSHVVLLRLTGNDGRRDAEDGAVVRMAGEIHAPGTMCDVVALLGQTGWHGELVVFDGEAQRSVFFDRGHIVGATTTIDDERIGMVLWRHGVIDGLQHATIVAQLDGVTRFGRLGTSLGFFTQETLFKFLARQLDEIVCATFAIADGAYYFLDGFDESRLATRHRVSATGLLMDGLTRIDELRHFRQKIPGPEFVPARTERANPPGEHAELYALVDGARSIEQLGRMTGKGEFETTKVIHALMRSRHVVLLPPRESGGAAAVVKRANAALVALHQRADTAGKGTLLRESITRHTPASGVDRAWLTNPGPDEVGQLPPEPLLAAAGAHAGAGAEQRLREVLHEYVAFALFCAGGVLGPEHEAALDAEIRPLLDEITPEA